jgi:hypothetical protein
LDNTPLIRGEGTVYVSSLCAQQYINNWPSTIHFSILN